MVVDSIIDAYGLSLGFYIYNVLWDIFAQTGLVYLPIIVLIFGAVQSSFESGMEDFNTRSSLRSVSVGLFGMLLAMVLALYPMVKLNFDEVKYFARQCTTDSTSTGKITIDIMGDEAEFVSSNMSVQMGNRVIRAPVLFTVAIKLGQGIKNWAVKDLPCSTELSLISDTMLNQSIADEQLRTETKEFIATCYNPARRKYINQYSSSGLYESDGWPGSRTLLTRSGYYDNKDADGFYSRVPRYGFGGTTNVIEESASLPTDYGYPTCKEWWLGVGNVNTPYVNSEALSTRLFDSLSTWLKDNNASIYDTVTTKLNRVKNVSYNYVAMKDVVVHQSLFSQIKLQQLSSLSTTDYGTQGDTGVVDWVARGLGTLGVAGKSIEQFSGASMLQIAMPMVKPFILMIILISYLPAMLMSRFKWKYITLFHGVVMSILFWPFFWELARLIDDTIMTALGVSITEVNTLILSQWIAASLYLVGPVLFSTCLGWVGLASADSAFNKMAGSAGSAGQGGAGVAKGAAKKGVKKAAKTVVSGGAGAAS